ncbi:MAG: adenosylcobinamide-GDP ribazoletransferase, partial [Thermoplasmata archaeon]
MIDYISSIISFFSRIPGKSDINKASEISYLLPFLGILFGFIFSLFAILLMFIPKIIYSLIVIIFIYLILGLLHLDGLA